MPTTWTDAEVCTLLDVCQSTLRRRIRQAKQLDVRPPYGQLTHRAPRRWTADQGAILRWLTEVQWQASTRAAANGSSGGATQTAPTEAAPSPPKRRRRSYGARSKRPSPSDEGGSLRTYAQSLVSRTS